jgi:hydrogenase maturation protease
MTRRGVEYIYLRSCDAFRGIIARMSMLPGEPAAAPRTVVLGIGNVLLSDDGAGIRVLREIEHLEGEDPGLEFVDGGTLGFMLAAELEHASNLLVIDAVQMHARPGCVRRYEDAGMDRFLRGRRTSVHEIGLRDLLDIARLRGRLPARRALIGIQPESTAIGEKLSAPVELAVPVATQLARDLLRRWRMASLWEALRRLA